MYNDTIWQHCYFNFLIASDGFCSISLTFGNSLGSDQARQNVGPDLDPNCLILIVFLKLFILNKEEKYLQTTNNLEILPSMQSVKLHENKHYASQHVFCSMRYPMRLPVL